MFLIYFKQTRRYILLYLLLSFLILYGEVTWGRRSGKDENCPRPFSKWFNLCLRIV